MKNLILAATMLTIITSCSSDSNNDLVTEAPDPTSNTTRTFTAKNLNPSVQSLAGMVANVTSTVNTQNSLSNPFGVKVGDVITINDPNNTFADSPRIEYTIKNEAGDVIQTSVVKRNGIATPWIDETTGVAEITVE